MKKVLTFGEVMMRLTPPDYLRFSQAQSFNVNYGGSEFNVAAALSNFGISTKFITRLPHNEIGFSARSEIRKYGIESEHIIWGGDRLGIYFLEQGSSVRDSNVIYDRVNSAMATIQKRTIYWEEVFKNVDFFHWSGITPAISSDAAEVCLEALQVADRMGVKISVDLNYRKKLWQYGKEPSEIMPQLLQYCHILHGDLDTAFLMLGKEQPKPDYTDKTLLKVYYKDLLELYPKLETVSTTLRYSESASRQKIGGVLYVDNKIYTSKIYDVYPVVDRVGTGDAFMAGLLYGTINAQMNYQQTIDFASAACYFKHSVYGDVNLASCEEVEKILIGENIGKVNR